ncbi:glycoside hydrolase family 78 protein [Paraglaciecola aquimarina]|uniref:alpha-L-rhamnosidase n=1 Tax=Paraglaciecola algarum TaxID=3050085 RepID=A0ABS9D5I0_9ALTE|nr:alpha-L-rhamnosidase [Paraglaciecola sp. G1-23]MCF2946931.1 glycoside hydrolase family 78 protein [Paraglaciecola sp. G1-23]
MYSAMIKVRCLGLIGFMLLLTACSFEPNDMVNSNKIVNATAPIGLKVGEGFVDPIGYYEKTPRFSWLISPKANYQFQQAFQIQVASEAATIGAADLWDSQKQLSANNAWIKYQGKPLASRQKVYWRVRIWDEQDKVSPWSELATIELGLLSNQDWQGQWIRHPETGETDNFDFIKKDRKTKTQKVIKVSNKVYRPEYLRRTFTAQPTIEQARLYITSKGIFNAYINGKKVSEDVMTPGWTPYLKRIETLTYDVTSLVNSGNNVLSATVAEGWYTGRILKPRPLKVKPSALLAQLEIRYSDGSTQLVTTDKNWQVTLDGPIRAAGNYDGETYDANYEMPGWNNVDFNAQSWNKVISEEIEPQVALSPKRHQTPAVKLELPAISIVDVANPKQGVVVFDMGQNMLGVPELNIPVIANQKVTVRFAEALNKETFYTKNLRSAKATDYYIPATSGDINYVPTFTFHGYRYVELSGFDSSKPPELSWVKGRVLHSDFDVTANFESSHQKLNKLAENVVWGLRGNFLDIPTDCPQRDERLGWTGDAQVFAAPSMYMADVYGFWAAWMESVREAQAKDGGVPNFVPNKGHGFGKLASAGWGDVAVIIPWELYLLNGDKQFLQDNYAMIKRWIDFHQSKSEQYTSSLRGFKDWLQPYADKGQTPQHLISTAYYARSLDYAAKIANVLGHERDAVTYIETLSKVKQAFRDTYYDENTKVKSASTQTSYLLPIAFDLFEGQDLKKAQQHLVDTIEATGKHLGTGFLGTPLLAQVLQNIGRSDLMFDVLFTETYPSWFYSINNGATTTWERWDSYSLKDGFSKASMNSLNHYAYGAVAKWFYEGILGINAASPGFKEINIAPQFNQRLTQASGSYKTPQGEVKVSWQIVQGKLDMQVTIPKNSHANVVFPQVESLTINGVSIAEDELLKKPMLSNLSPGVYRLKGIVQGV